MAIQIFGTKKCKETQKAIRFFKERRVQAHFINLLEKGLSRGELKSVCRSIRMEELVDPKSKTYEKQGLEYIVYDVEEKLLEYPELIKTPIVRNGQKATLGYQPDVWKEWLD